MPWQGLSANEGQRRKGEDEAKQEAEGFHGSGNVVRDPWNAKIPLKLGGSQIFNREWTRIYVNQYS